MQPCPRGQVEYAAVLVLCGNCLQGGAAMPGQGEGGEKNALCPEQAAVNDLAAMA